MSAKIKHYRPTSPGVRFRTTTDYSVITADKPEKSLVVGLKKKSGRNNTGRITVRHRGGGHKRSYRIIDFKRRKEDVPAKVLTIEYDPNRTAFIALICYADGEKNYILCPEGLSVGDTVLSGSKAEVKPGHTMKLKDIPVGTLIHNIELRPGKGGQMAKSAGSYAQLLSKEGKYFHIKLPSGETRLVLNECRASIGQVSNPSHSNINIGKAGRSRWLGKRPTVRGVAMNPVDHPHGGGEGRTSGGRHPVSPWGMPTKGYKTRKKNKQSNKYIVSRRKR